MINLSNTNDKMPINTTYNPKQINPSGKPSRFKTKIKDKNMYSQI